ncbi:ankyrin repeat-containing protein [Calothrix parasitica NIES-267]|uniref:Ankyrin repeat-containing protein n=1 Tax=Calothrix parasitica NIES-267 TaxID=1973488 RepID=A0A1Z4LHD5_9CYAN|nr:ankyrin repeat-containing protein [Calothrix parasitica NIES-267]
MYLFKVISVDMGNNNIFEAIIDNNLPKVKEFIQNGFNVNQKHSEIQLTPLIQAINLRRLEIIKILLEAGADPNLCQDVYATPLELATSLGNIEVIKILLRAGANPNFFGIDSSALERAIRIERIDIIKILLDAGADLSHKNRSLIYAANNGKFEIVKFLVETGSVYINFKNRYGETALDKARYWGYQEIVDYLLPWAK